jgi:hypothetical protein
MIVEGAVAIHWLLEWQGNTKLIEMTTGSMTCEAGGPSGGPFPGFPSGEGRKETESHSNDLTELHMSSKVAGLLTPSLVRWPIAGPGIRLIGIVYFLSSIHIKLLKEAVAKCSCRLALLTDCALAVNGTVCTG